ncbi:hypothetical protein HMI55_004128 [Coelomomyces lativittatus]|nr:hypothetical protein HMI55_004128 [Coelomomyces lativittatus]
MNPNTTTTTTTEEPPCPPPVLIGMGNPLLDISAEVDEAFLKKYGLEANNAILAEEKHMPLYEEMIATYPVRYIAGGAAQSTLRGAQWLLPKGSTGFLGCVGEDGYAHTLRKVMKEEGVQVRYMTTSTYPTGTCAVLLTNQGNQRSLVAHLAAAQQYTLPHLQLHWDWVTQAQCFYVEGYFLTVAYEAILQLAQYAATSKKIFAFNLSAPFVCALPTSSGKGEA